MSYTDMTGTEMQESLTGYDEIAIEQSWGKTLQVLASDHVTKFQRALVFVHQRREGLSDADAKKACMEMGLGEVQGYFADDPEDIDDEEPETDAGKDASSDETAPEN